MTFVVTVASDVECKHKGVASLMSASKLTVSGKSVVVKDDLLAATLAGCTQLPPPQSNIACTKVTVFGSGESTKLTVRGKGVLLDSLSATTIGVPENTLTCKDAKQTKLRAG